MGQRKDRMRLRILSILICAAVSAALIPLQEGDKTLFMAAHDGYATSLMKSIMNTSQSMLQAAGTGAHAFITQWNVTQDSDIGGLERVPVGLKRELSLLFSAIKSHICIEDDMQVNFQGVHSSSPSC